MNAMLMFEPPGIACVRAGKEECKIKYIAIGASEWRMRMNGSTEPSCHLSRQENSASIVNRGTDTGTHHQSHCAPPPAPRILSTDRRRKQCIPGKKEVTERNLSHGWINECYADVELPEIAFVAGYIARGL